MNPVKTVCKYFNEDVGEGISYHQTSEYHSKRKNGNDMYSIYMLFPFLLQYLKPIWLACQKVAVKVPAVTSTVPFAVNDA